MKKLFVLVAAVVLVMAASCDTLNIGTGGITRGPVVETVTFTADNWNGAEPASMSVSWASGTAPYTISIDMGGGTTANVPAGTAAGTSPFTQDFTLVYDAATAVAGVNTYTYSIVITDANGQVNDPAYTGTYEVREPLNADPVITNVAVTGGNVVTVSVTDAEGDDVTVTITDITGLTVNTNSVVVTGGNGDAVFTYSADDMAVGGSGTATVTAADAGTNAAAAPTETAAINIDPVELEPAEGQIVAHLMSATAAVNETVTVRVLCGDFPAGAAFNYMNGVGVTVTDGGDFVDDTFNVGAIGGEPKDVDGIWADMSPAPSTFFVPENFMMYATDVAADSSLDFMGFNITPIGAGEVSGGGDLFNFGIAFDAAGTYELGFIEFQDVKRTYYSDNAAVEYNWTDITNVLENLTSSITVS